MSSCSAVSSVPGMNSMPAAAHAAAIRAQPSTESWSVSASAAKPSRCAVRRQFLRRERAVGKMRVQMEISEFHLTILAGRINSPLILSRMPLTNLPLSWVENFLAMSTASLMLTTGGMSSRCSIS